VISATGSWGRRGVRVRVRVRPKEMKIIKRGRGKVRERLKARLEWLNLAG
jgi:hypothetical protein